jgi:hypothetical protein
MSAAQFAAVVHPADMDVIHGLQHIDFGCIRPISGTDAEILMRKDALAGGKDVDVGIGGDASPIPQIRDVDAVPCQQFARPPAGRIRADGAEIERGLAEPSQLHGDVQRIAADKRLRDGRPEPVDAVVADGGEAEALHADLFRDGKAANADRGIRGQEALKSSGRFQ